MSTIWQSLAWKEWHEHKWKLASILAVLLCVTTSVLPNDVLEADFLLITLIICIVPLSMFVGFGTAAGERARGTQAFLQALPVPLHRVAMHKLAFGLLTISLPVLVTLIYVMLWFSGTTDTGLPLFRGLAGAEKPFLLPDWRAGIAVVTTLTAISFYLWSAALGVNRRDEVSAGAFSLACMFGWWGLLVLLWQVLLIGSKSADTTRIIALGLGTAPGGIMPMSQTPAIHGTARVFGFCAMIVAHVMLAGWYVRRFGKVEPNQYSARAEVRTATFTTSQKAAWRWPVQAIAWKQLRETAPIVVAGFGCIFVMFGLLAIAQGFHTISANTMSADELAAGFAGTSVAFGVMIALVAGIGVLLSDVGSSLNTFWRSRPIHPDLWFWTKYFTAIAIILVAIYVPMAVTLLLLSSQATAELLEGGWIPLLSHVSVFAAAVAMTALFRHAVYAAILSIPAIFIGAVLLLAGMAAGRLAGWIEWLPGEFWNLSEQQFLCGLLLGVVINTLIAWLAVRFDWGVKR
jgi:hypothetical protein